MSIVRAGGGLATFLALLLVGCAPEQIAYQDPLAGLHRLPGADAPLNASVRVGPTIGLVPSENIERTLLFGDRVGDGLQAFGPLTNTSALRDRDPQYLVNGAVAVLRERHPQIRLTESLAAAASQRLSNAIVLDIRNVLATRSGQTTTVVITAITFDAAQRPVSRVISTGTAVAPFPAWSFGLREAADAALLDFRQRIAATQP